MKVCTKCGVEKPLNEFGNCSAKKDNKRNDCKDCYNSKTRSYRKANGDIHTKVYEKTPKGLLVRTYRNMYSRVAGIVKGKAHLYAGLEILPREEFYNWALSSEDFFSIYNAWIASGYDHKLSPSIDRRDSKKGYTFDNIRWLTHSENSRLGNASRFQTNQNARQCPAYHTTA